MKLSQAKIGTRVIDCNNTVRTITAIDPMPTFYYRKWVRKTIARYDWFFELPEKFTDSFLFAYKVYEFAIDETGRRHDIFHCLELLPKEWHHLKDGVNFDIWY